jgi:hypothetical protein
VAATGLQYSASAPSSNRLDVLDQRTQLFPPFTAAAVDLSLVEPSPSCPLLFHPQAQTVPSALSAKQWAEPAAIAFMPGKSPRPLWVLTAAEFLAKAWKLDNKTRSASSGGSCKIPHLPRSVIR